jgi:hypothetical protein
MKIAYTFKCREVLDKPDASGANPPIKANPWRHGGAKLRVFPDGLLANIAAVRMARKIAGLPKGTRFFIPPGFKQIKYDFRFLCRERSEQPMMSTFWLNHITKKSTSHPRPSLSLSSGQVTIEYFLLVAAVIVATLVSVSAFDNNVQTSFESLFTTFATNIVQDNPNPDPVPRGGAASPRPR